MPQIIVVSICSREKNSAPGLLPAIERYRGPHIAYVANVAKGMGYFPFFILSGRFGLVAEREGVRNYDYRLVMQDVQSMVTLVAKQLKEIGAREIHFHTKLKDTWVPYLELLQRAASRVDESIEVIIHELPENI